MTGFLSWLFILFYFFFQTFLNSCHLEYKYKALGLSSFWKWKLLKGCLSLVSQNCGEILKNSFMLRMLKTSIGLAPRVHTCSPSYCGGPGGRILKVRLGSKQEFIRKTPPPNHCFLIHSSACFSCTHEKHVYVCMHTLYVYMCVCLFLFLSLSFKV